MKLLPILLFFLTSFSIQAQDALTFDKRFVESEDHWICFAKDSIGDYNFGFIYIDPSAGLTLDYSGSFKIDPKGKFIPSENNGKSNIKYRLMPNKTLVAFIPESKFTELKIEKTPSWLKNYKKDEETVEHLYRWGYMYNEWNEFEKALVYLEKANSKNPDFDGLQTELAFSYNALKLFDKAEIALQKAIQLNPNDCYTLKELAYTYKNQKNLEKSAAVYEKMATLCKENKYLQETAYNLAYQYFELKDKKNFSKWNIEARKWIKESDYTKYLDILEQKIK